MSEIKGVIKRIKYVQEGDISAKFFPPGVDPRYAKLVLYNYTDKCQYKKHWNEFTLNSRGHVFEVATGKPVAVTFPKFFNFHELPLEKQKELLKSKDFKVTWKVDGSLAIFYYYDGDWRCNTRGSFDSDQSNTALEMFHRMGGDLSGCEGYTFLAEVVYPENRIIIDYGDEEDLVFLTAFHTKSGIEMEWETFNVLMNQRGFTIVDQISFNHIESIIEEIQKLGLEEEGFVVRFNNGERVKFKSTEYLEVARLLNGMSKKTLIDGMKDIKYEGKKKIVNFIYPMINGRVSDDLMSLIPEEVREPFEEMKKEVEDLYRKIKDEIYETYLDIKRNYEGLDLLKIRTIIGKSEIDHKPAIFNILGNREDKNDEYIKKQIKWMIKDER